MTRDQARRLAAELRVAEAYDTERSTRPFDMTHRRREYAHLRLLREVVAAGRELGLGTDVEDIEAALGVGHHDVATAFERECRRRLRGEVSSAVVASLEAARVQLSDELGDGLDDPDEAEIERPRLLWEYIAGERPSYTSGASRTRR